MKLNKMKLATFTEIRPHAAEGLETQSGASAVNINLMMLLLKVFPT